MTAIKNNYIFQLAGDLPSSGTSVKISNDLERDQAVVFTSGYVVLRSGNKIERVKGSATGGTLTLSKRGLDQSDADVEVTDLKKDWKEGTTCYVTVLAVQLQEVFDTIASGALLPPSYADDTARDAAITSPENGMIIYNEVDGLLNKYVGGTWVDDDGGAVVANASETVAGKLEEPTQTQSDNGDSVGETTAKLALTPLKAGRSVQANTWIKGADAGGDDTYVLTLTPAPTTYSDGMEVLIKPTTTNTGACTIDVNSLGVKNIKTPGGNDPSNGDLVTSRYNKLRYNGTDFIIVDKVQATTTEAGSVEMLTDAEAVTGTDETRYVNSKQLKNRAGFTRGYGGGCIARSDATVTGSATGINYKRIQIKGSGTISVSVVGNSGDNTSSYPRIGIYKNTTLIATSGDISISTSPVTLTTTDLTVAHDDYINIQVTQTGSSTVDISNLRIFATPIPNYGIATIVS